MSALERIADIVESDFGSANPERLLSPKAVIRLAQNQVSRRAAFGQKRLLSLVTVTHQYVYMGASMFSDRSVDLPFLAQSWTPTLETLILYEVSLESDRVIGESARGFSSPRPLLFATF